MKSLLNLLAFCILFLVCLTSCNKDSYQQSSNEIRTIKFQLYTEQDFSSDSKNITFTLFIRTHESVIFDSVLSTMKIKDIPAFENKLVFEKKIAGVYNSDLAAGFDYTIENVGESKYIDTSLAGNPFKLINFSFR
ncbi:MAG: hypothetical protein QM764_01230 [Chitinophagaceae bacterium]